METFRFLYTFYPIWLPILLGLTAWKLWKSYVSGKFLLEQETTVLELKIPGEVMKTPLAMELFITTLYQTSGESTFIDRLIEGKSRAWFSLELVSLEGKVKFFIWTRTSYKNFIESQLYAQFPGIEVSEAPDYTRDVIFDKEKNKIWGCEFKLTENDAYPIKTYVDYGLDKPDMEEEGKSDPLVNVLEFLGSLGKGEQAWIHIYVKAHKAEHKKEGTWFEKVDWKHHAEHEIEKIKHKRVKEGDEFTEQKLLSGDKEKIKAIERSLGKIPFDTGIRVIYIASREKYRKPNESALQMAFKQYNSPNLNSFKPNGKIWMPKYDYPWQDYQDRRKNRDRRKLLEAFKMRSYFHHPYDASPAFVMTTEELATIYHFPGRTATTPTLDRIVAKKAEPPPNLPI